MSTAKIHARNLLANWTSHGASLIVLFFLSPFVVHTLGKVEYGIWSLLSVLIGYMGILDLGVRASTGRYVTLYLGKNDHQGIDATIRTSLGLFSAGGLLVVAAGVGVGMLFPSCFRSVPEEYHLIALMLLPVMAVGVWLAAIDSVFANLLGAHDRFDLMRTVDLGVLACQTIGTVLALWSGYGIGGLAGVLVCCRVLSVAGHYWLARRVYPRLRVWPLMLNKGHLRELLGYGLAAFASTIAGQVIGQTDLVITGAVINVSSVAVYSVGAMLVYYSGTFMAGINTTLFPSIQRVAARTETENVRRLFLRAGRLSLICGLLVYVGLAMFAEPFIRLWMLSPKFDEGSVRLAAVVMTILAASKLPLLFVGASVPVLNAMGHVRVTASLAVAEALLKLSLSLVFVLVFGWGLAGIAGGTLAGRLLIGTFIVPWFACAKTGVPWWKYVTTIGGLEVLAGLLLAGVCLLVQRLLPIDSWPWFFGQVALVTAGYGVIALCLLVPADDRQRALNWMLRRPGRQPRELVRINQIGFRRID